jgi:hypothetical protein
MSRRSNETKSLAMSRTLREEVSAEETNYQSDWAGEREVI